MSDSQRFAALDGDSGDGAACRAARSVLGGWRRHWLHCGCHVLSGAAIGVLLLLVVAGRSPTPSAPAPGPTDGCDGVTWDPRRGVCGRQAMVSTTNPDATRAALEVLRAGGNVVDAAAAAQLMLGLTQPLSTSIGGGCFVVAFNASTGAVSALDAREEAPAAYTPTTFCAPNSTVGPDGGCTQYIDYPQLYLGGMAIGVPGVPRALERMLRDNGTMTFAQVAAPTIRAARAGFRLTQFMYDQLLQFRDFLWHFNATRTLYFNSDGQPKTRPGGLMYNPDYAALLERLAEKGVDDFYTGQVARDIVEAARNARNDLGLASVMTLSDLASYAAVYRPPMRFTYRDFEVAGMNLPTSGTLTLAYILAVLETLDLSDSIVRNSVEYMHRVLDAEDLAFADRNAWMADADFVDVPVAGLLNKSYVRQRARRFLQATAAAGAPLPAGEPPGPARKPSAAPSAKEGTETTHLVVADAAGNVVSMTTTIQTWWGSGVVVPGWGFPLNNELSDFNREPNAANSPSGERRRRRTAVPPDDATVGGKRPRSSMSPLIVFRQGRPYVALGGSGGSTIIGGVLNALVPVLDYGAAAQEAVDSPRALSRNDRVCVEPVLAANRTVMARLAGLGFQFRTCDPELLAVVQLVRLEPGPDGRYTLHGAADRTRLTSAHAEGY